MLNIIDVLKSKPENLLTDHKPDITDRKNYSLWIGESPLLFQAHVDVIHPANNIKQTNFLITGEGLGADDRAGVFACLDLKRRFPEINILLTHHEETGGQGMDVFTDAITEEQLEHINLAIAIDREGCGHYVSYNTLPDEIAEYAKTFGFWSDYGTFSDIEIFSDHFGIPSINVSCGYHDQHSKKEYLVIDELQMTIKRLQHIIKNPIETRYSIPKLDPYYYGKYENVQNKYQQTYLLDDRYHGRGSYRTRWDEPIQAEEVGTTCETCGRGDTPLAYINEFGLTCRDCYEDYRDYIDYQTESKGRDHKEPKFY